MSDNMQDTNGVLVQGHIKIFDPESQKVYIDKRNAIHYENMSIALAESLSNAGQGFISKVVDERSVNNTDPVRNKTEVRHLSGTNYTDIIVSCLLDYGEPNGQDAFDTASSQTNNYVFDELGLRSYSASGTGRLITHVIFHPVQKSLNRLIQIDYTVRVQSLAG
jgi:hypothetical protein